MARQETGGELYAWVHPDPTEEGLSDQEMQFQAEDSSKMIPCSISWDQEFKEALTPEQKTSVTLNEGVAKEWAETLTGPITKSIFDMGLTTKHAGDRSLSLRMRLGMGRPWAGSMACNMVDSMDLIASKIPPLKRYNYLSFKPYHPSPQLHPQGSCETLRTRALLRTKRLLNTLSINDEAASLKPLKLEDNNPLQRTAQSSNQRSPYPE